MSGRVRSRSSDASRSIKPQGAQSTKTGVAPVLTIASAVARAEIGEVSTFSPGPQPSARKESSRASRPLATPTACIRPQYAASADSNSATSRPRIYQPLSPTALTASRTLSRVSRHWRLKSLSSTISGFPKRPELIIVADIIGGVVHVRCQHEEDGIRRVAVLHCPDHGRNVHCQARRVEDDLFPGDRVVHHETAFSMYTGQELVQGAVSVRTPQLASGDIEDREASLDLKRNVSGRLRETQMSTQILDQREAVNRDAGNSRGILASLPRDGGAHGALLDAPSHVAHDSGRVARHHGVGRDVAGDDGARRHHGALPDGDAGQDGRVPSDRHSAFHQRAQQRPVVPAAAREIVVTESRVGTDEDIVLDRHSIPDLHPALDRDPVAEDSLVFDERVIADIAVRADLRTRQNMSEGPNAGTGTYAIGLGNGQFVLEERHGRLPLGRQCDQCSTWTGSPC